MLNILYDNQIFNLQKYGGISRYFSELMSRLNSDSDFSITPKNYCSNNVYLKTNQLTSYNEFNNFPAFRGKKRIENFIVNHESEKIKMFLEKGKFDVFHPTYYNSSFLKNLSGNKPFVLTVHDMIHELYYDKQLETLHPETINKSILIPKANHIIAISETTKKDILHFYPDIDEKKISVIYHGNSLGLFKSQSKRSVEKKYILYVGGRKHYKNFMWMLKAIAPLLVQKNILLICAGGGYFDDYEQQNIDQFRLNKYVKHIEIDSDLVLQNLYEHAQFFIYPSQYEGFGIPILESFACKCPALLSDASCFPEIAGNAGLFFKSGNDEDLLTQINVLLENNQLRNDLIEKGITRLRDFSWEKTVNEHKVVYSSFL